jgi:hypothetical protein
MAARKKRPVVQLSDKDLELEPSDVTEKLYPTGTPQGDDGAVLPEGEIEVTQARKIGAITADAARANKRGAQTLDRRIKGDKVGWNNKDLMLLFDEVKTTFGANTILIVPQNTSTGVTHKPVPMIAFRSVAELYAHMETLNRGQPVTMYRVAFKDSTSQQIRAWGEITMPEVVESVSATPQQPQYPWQLPQPTGWGVSGPPYQYPMQPPQPAAQPVPVPQQPQQPQIIIPPGTDPAIAGLLQQLLADQKTTQIQLATALGGLEESKRALTQHQYAQAAAPQPVMQAPVQPVVSTAQARPGMTLLGYGADGQPLFGFPPAQSVQAPTPATVAAPPPPPPPPPPPVPSAPVNPTDQLTKWVSDAAVMVQSLEKMRKLGAVMGGMGPQVAEPEEDDEEPEAPKAAEPPPLTILPLGNSPDAAVYAMNPDGSINWSAVLLGNLNRIGPFLNNIANGVKNMNTAVTEFERNRPIMAQAQVVQQVPNESMIGHIPVRSQ